MRQPFPGQPPIHESNAGFMSSFEKDFDKDTLRSAVCGPTLSPRNSDGTCWIQFYSFWVLVSSQMLHLRRCIKAMIVKTLLISLLSLHISRVHEALIMLSAETLKTSRGCTETDPQLYDTTVMELGRLTEKQLLQLQTEVDNTGTLQERTRAIQPSRQSAENRVITLLDVARQSETLQAEQPEVSFMQRLNLGATPEPFTRSSLPQSPSHYKALKAAVLSEAGVVFTTCSNSANKELVVKYKPQIIIFDEAAFTKEMESILPMYNFHEIMPKAIYILNSYRLCPQSYKEPNLVECQVPILHKLSSSRCLAC